jgi:ribonuclease HI
MIVMVEEHITTRKQEQEQERYEQQEQKNKKCVVCLDHLCESFRQFPVHRVVLHAEGTPWGVKID